jgi:hypothetical protein
MSARSSVATVRTECGRSRLRAPYQRGVFAHWLTASLASRPIRCPRSPRPPHASSRWSFPSACLHMPPSPVATRQHIPVYISCFAYYDTNERLFSRVLFARLNRILIVTWFGPIFGDSFAFAGLVAGIEVISAFRFFAGLFFVRIFVDVIGHRALHWTHRQQSRS